MKNKINKNDNINLIYKILIWGELKILLDHEGYLKDSHINLFGEIVNLSTFFNIQNLLYVPENIMPIPPGQPNLQIIDNDFSSSSVGHWICTHYDSIVNHIYDSLNLRMLEKDHEAYLRKLYGLCCK